jgi:hypothetical protein
MTLRPIISAPNAIARCPNFDEGNLALNIMRHIRRAKIAPRAKVSWKISIERSGKVRGSRKAYKRSS